MEVPNIDDTFLVLVKMLPILLKKSIGRGIASTFLAKKIDCFYWYFFLYYIGLMVCRHSLQLNVCLTAANCGKLLKERHSLHSLHI